MEALSIGLLPLNSLTVPRYNSKKQHTTHCFTSSLSSPLKLGPIYGIRHRNTRVIRMQAVDEEFEVKQAKDMAAARKRWEALVREEKVKLLTPKEAGYAVQLSNKTLLDVRPTTEHKKEVGGVACLRYLLTKAEKKFPKDTDLIVACQKGLRSLAACEILYNAGYRDLFWVQGGLEAAEEEDLEREGPQPFKFAGIGGISEFLGWTDQQRAAAAKEGWGYRLVFSARLVGIFIFADALFIGAQQVGHYLQDIGSH